MPAFLRFVLFPVTLFLGSFLLFLSEPIVARELLPLFGGSAAVWITCLVFFQVTLLAGYLYAHTLTLGKSHPAVHLGMLLAAAGGALGWAGGFVRPSAPGARPVLSLFAALAVTIGLPFLVLASTSPLLQAWMARGNGGQVPYRLFALSNLASLLALLAYPSLIEPHLPLSLQRSYWAAGVCAYALLSSILTVGMARLRVAFRSEESAKGNINSGLAGTMPRPGGSLGQASLRVRLLWFLLPMAGAMQLSAVTAHLTLNIAAMPLLWVLPLAVYLLTFIVAFEVPGIAAWRGVLLRLLAVMLAGLGYMLSHPDLALSSVALSIGFFLLEEFVACLFLHSELYALRPADRAQSTVFYLILAAGGAAGSFVVGIGFPLLFRGNYDLALTFLTTALLALAVVWNSANAWPQRMLWAAGSGLLLFLCFALHTAYLHNTLLATRNFYGSLRVQQGVTEHGAPIRTLLNGSIQHGTQIFSADLIHVPTTYYAENSGAGLALLHCCSGRTKRVGVVGLGAGTLAAYGRPGDSFRFYEIDPAVLPVAQHLFTWLRDSAAQLSFKEGDARASLADERSQGFDVLCVDAFSGDAIPLHLLSVEALALYRRHLAAHGILAFHVSNAYVDLEPEVGALARSAGMAVRTVASAEDKQSGAFKATWVLATDDPTFFDQPALAPYVHSTESRPEVRAWTDDASSLFPLVRW